MKNSDLEIDKALLDVRKAYRLLFAYQSRVLDLVKFIGNQLGYEYKGGWPKFSNPSPKYGGGSLDSWAWDWLNMVCYEFHFKSRAEGVLFSVFIVSDTGFFDFETNPNNQNKTNLNAYQEPSKSQTKLVFFCGKDYWINEYTEFEEIFKAEINTINFREENKVFLGKSYPFSSFSNIDTAQRHINDFVEFCRQNGIPEIKPIKEGIQLPTHTI